jgi:hypothetical protein
MLWLVPRNQRNSGRVQILLWPPSRADGHRGGVTRGAGAVGRARLRERERAVRRGQTLQVAGTATESGTGGVTKRPAVKRAVKKALSRFTSSGWRTPTARGRAGHRAPDWRAPTADRQSRLTIERRRRRGWPRSPGPAAWAVVGVSTIPAANTVAQVALRTSRRSCRLGLASLADGGLMGAHGTIGPSWSDVRPSRVRGFQLCGEDTRLVVRRDNLFVDQPWTDPQQQTGGMRAAIRQFTAGGRGAPEQMNLS